MRTEKYTAQKNRLPESGRQVTGSIEGDDIIVYQAFNTNITAYAVANQKFGGSHYSFSRMSWIKPGFLWMMHRAGWAAKEHQQSIVAITLSLIHFKTILQEATISSYDNRLFASEEEWRSALDRTDVRLQWDPDHDPFGQKQERKAIQLGLKGNILKQFCTDWIVRIEDITDFVKAEHQKVLNKAIDDLNVPYEEVIELNDPKIERRIGIDPVIKL